MGKIVIADDNLEICELVIALLTIYGYEVDSVNNGYQLLIYLETNNPSVIILDLMMPDKDGMSILNTLKQISPYSRIIIFTGHSEYRDSVYARTADKFLVKGDCVEDLLAAVKEFTS